MSDWRDQIVREFVPDVARLTLVADPDGLLLDTQVLAGIRTRGFELLSFEDPVAFRYEYESRFRVLWDDGKRTDRQVAVRYAGAALDSLPYDLLEIGRRLSVSLGMIFPNLSSPMLVELSHRDLDSLFEAQERYTPHVLGENATKEFILKHVFRIDLELVDKPSDLLRILLRRHCQEQQIPALIDRHLIRLLRLRREFRDWPLEAIVSDRQTFFAFLQERWPIFLDQQASREVLNLQGNERAWGLKFPGPVDLPFADDDIRGYVQRLFLEGLLYPVPHQKVAQWAQTWLRWGIHVDVQSDRTRRVEGLISAIESDMPVSTARHTDWIQLAKTWAELSFLVFDADADRSSPVYPRLESLQDQMDARFVDWLTEHYAGLVNLPPAPPVMLHHVPRFLHRHIADAKAHKVALILMDGLALVQWNVLREELVKQIPDLHISEDAIFAWIPTLTSVSRQATFAGWPPMYFPDSIGTTDREPSLWKRFWLDHGLTAQEVAYAKGLGDGPLKQVQALTANPQNRVVGLVVDKIDRIMHGMELGAMGMHNQVRQWARQPFMANLIHLLLEGGYRIWLTSDHGNIEASGCGSLGEGAMADFRGRRVRIYSDSSLRRLAKERIPDAWEWPTTGLPEDFLPLLAPGRQAFVQEGKRVVSHGGASLTETIVPLAQIGRREA